MKVKVLCASLMAILAAIHIIVFISNGTGRKGRTSIKLGILTFTSLSLVILSMLSIFVFDILALSCVLICVTMIIAVSNVVDYIVYKQKEEPNDQTKKTKL